jgi:hypothetical protein
MGSETVSPENFAERIIWFTITRTYLFYLFGACYFIAPVIGWSMVGYLCYQMYVQTDKTPEVERIKIPITVWVWIFSMIVMEIALIMGHLDFNLGTGKLIKSTVGWFKGWALLAVFPLIGCLNIRPRLIYQAACVVCKHTLILLPFLYLASIIGLPADLYVSPLKVVGPSNDFYTVSFYGRGPDGAVRWRLFTPWGPALGFIANIYFIFAIEMKGTRWFWYGVCGSVAMCLVSKSRLALVSILVVYSATWLLSRLTKPSVLRIMAAGITVIGISAPFLIETISVMKAKFSAARADSSRVRAALGRIAKDRWQREAPIWGHGIVEKGPHITEHMPIGSHHSWFGLLFVKGMVGFLALMIPMLWSFIELVIKAQTDQEARVALSMVLILFLYTFGENLEILAYLFWPALVVMGIAFKTPMKNPLKDPLP